MINFELHLTTNKLFITELDTFIKTCHLLSTKPLSIKLEHNLTSEHVITTIYFNCNSREAIPLAKELNNQFKLLNIPIERIKIEVPLNALPLKAKITDTDDDTSYLEWSGEIHIPDPAHFLSLCQKYDSILYASKATNEPEIGFISVRKPLGDKSLFCDYIKQFTDDLKLDGYSLISQQFDHCIYDSHPNIKCAIQ